MKCSQNLSLNILRLVGLGLIMFVAVGFLIVINLRRKGTNYLSVLSRIMTNYLQIISFAQSFNLGWPDSLKKVFSSISFISDSSDMVLSLDCFMSSAGII